MGDFTELDVAEATFSVMTYNLWKTDGRPTFWATRREVLKRQLQKLDPDVLLVQELCPEISECVLEALPSHCCICSTSCKASKVGDESRGSADTGELFEGWREEGNIFYRAAIFSLLDWGQEHIQQEEALRRLFWARLLPRALVAPSAVHLSSSPSLSLPHTLLFSTAHFTWQGHPRECESDINLRKKQARHAATALNRLQQPRDIACFFGGDLNESFWPKRVLEAAGFSDCFSALGLPCRPTHPCRPTLAHEDNNADSVLDWLFARGRQEATADGARGTVRPLLSTVVRDSVGLSSGDPLEEKIMSVQPSDHAPVLAVYRCSVAR